MQVRLLTQVAMILLLIASNVFAQCGFSAQVLGIDPSVRSAGMGGATTAAFWGADPNYWANPSLLGYHRGVRFESSFMQLVPDLADDIFFDTDRWTLGAWGVGLALATQPGDQGRIHLDFGESVATDASGIPIGKYHNFENVESWGLGINLLEFFENVVGPRAGSWSQKGDISIGMNQKHIESNLAGEHAESQTNDIGILLRATPYNSIAQPSDWLPMGLRVDVSLGRSKSSFKDAELNFLSPSLGGAIARDTRWGMGLHVAADVPKAWRENLQDGWTNWIVDLVTPLVSIGTTVDFSTTSIPRPASTSHQDCQEIRRFGVETTFLNVFTLRRGSISNPDGRVEDSSWGWSLGLNFRDVGGFRMDRAMTPQAAGLSTVDRDGFIAWLDLFAVSRELRKL